MRNSVFALLFGLYAAPLFAQLDYVEGVIVVDPAPGVAARGMGGGMRGTDAQANAPAPVSFLMPTERRSSLSIVMIPGGGLPSWSYTTTPDGRDGWAQQFARAGFPVYLLNPPAGLRDELGRWNKESVWPLWGFGPEFGAAYADSQHPVDAIETLESSFYIQRAPGGAAHLLSLLNQIGPTVILAHSAGGAAMFAVARAEHSDLLATIAVETTNCPANATELEQIYVTGNRAFLSLWGDNLDRGAPSMLMRFESCRSASDIISQAGGDARTISLADDLDIPGNSHLMMQDLNNLEIGRLILDWVADTVNEAEFTVRGR